MIALVIVGLAAVLAAWDIGRRSIAARATYADERAITEADAWEAAALERIDAVERAGKSLGERLGAIEDDYKLIGEEARAIRVAKGLGKR